MYNISVPIFLCLLQNRLIFLLLDEGNFVQLINATFLVRRSNLKGITLKTMIERQPPYMMYPVRLRGGNDSQWTVDSFGDHVRDITNEQSNFYGLFLNVLQVLEKEMNFETRYFTRR